ncbi:MAG TPA: hypothetical protein VFE13_16780 [Caulobacteraceae bacterium]|jgi:hypothetical protein|nr:hypothetical protein [Caulobacteraceae bacterium]
MTATEGIVVAGLIGIVVAYAELLARYRDDPMRAVLSWPAFSYALVNGGAGLLAAWWLSSFFPSIVAATGAKSIDGAKLAVVGGFGALAVMRTSLLKLKLNSGDEVSVGPAVIVDQLLTVVDRSVDRHLAERRATIASELAGRIDFQRDGTSLVALCLVLLQNPSATEQQQMSAVLQGLNGRTDIPANIKATSLLLALLGLVGETVLRQAVKQVSPAV